MTRLQQSLVIVLVVAVFGGLTFAGGASAATGDLTQPAGSEGCVELQAYHWEELCAEATFGEGLSGAEYVATYGTSVYVASSYAIEVLQKKPSGPGLTDLECLDGEAGPPDNCTPQTDLIETRPQSIIVSPDGKWVYVSEEDRGDSAPADSNELIVFSRDQTTGELTQEQCFTGNGVAGAGEGACTSLGYPSTLFDAGRHLVESPNGEFVFANDGKLVTVFKVDGSTGELTPESCAGESGTECPTVWPADANSNSGEMVVSPDSKFLYMSSPSGDPTVSWLSINTSTGKLTDPAEGSGKEDCIQDVSGPEFHCVNTMRGMVNMLEALAISPDANGSYVYALSGSEFGSGAVAVLARNPATGELTQLPGKAGCASSTGNDDEASGNEPGGPFACEHAPSLGQAESLIASGDGQNLYVATGYEGPESVVELHANAATGALSEDPETDGTDDDCYTSDAENSGVPNCTASYAGMNGIAEGLDGEPTLGLGSGNSELYMSSAGDEGIAVFQRTLPPQYTVTAAHEGGGSVSLESQSAEASCVGLTCTVYPNATVTITPTANSGFRFKAWSGGSCTGDTSPCNISPVTASETDKATFVQRFTVKGEVTGSGNTLTAADSSANDPECSGSNCTVDAGDTVTLTATAGPGYRFAGWSGGGCAPATETTYTAGALCTLASVQADATVTANFIAQYTVSGALSTTGGTVAVSVPSSDTIASCSGATTPQGSCTLDAGSAAIVTATPAPGFSFTGWSGGSCSGTVNPCHIASVGASETDSASFVLGAPPGKPIYVSGQTGRPGAPGIKTRPLDTIAHALEVVAAEPGTYNQILVADGSYNESVTLSGADDGLGVYGGYNEKWEATSTGLTTILGAPQAVLLQGATGVTLQQLTLHGQASPGASTYGVRAISGATVTLNDVQVLADQGSNGAEGATPGTAPAGGPGWEGDVGINGYSAPFGGDSVNPAAVVGAEGEGGSGGAPAEGANGAAGGCGGLGEIESRTSANEACNSSTVANRQYNFTADMYGTPGGKSSLPGAGEGGSEGTYFGTDGCDETNGNVEGSLANCSGRDGGSGGGGGGGSAGTPGPGATAPTQQGEAWSGGVGSIGGTGSPGGGGGGGAGGGESRCATGLCFSSSGNGGGGGGGGGAGGTGGGGGKPGGGSFGVYLDGGSSVTVEFGSTITAGNGGEGGRGAEGGKGGAGGAGGAGSTLNACANGVCSGHGGSGGAGGQGGQGGAGGGGEGGPSFAVYKADSGSSAELALDTVVTAGLPGSGGATPGAGPGAKGQGGSTTPCGSPCKYNTSLPLLPVYALLNGTYISVEVGCPLSAPSCSGTAELSTESSSSKAADVAHTARAHATVLGRLKFKLKGHKALALHMRLTAAGRKLVKKIKSSKGLAVLLKVKLKVPGHKQPTTYTQKVLLLKTKPKVKAPPKR
jgi:hypothetical protein